MAFRFRRRVRIMPGLRVNLSKSGASMSAGRKGAGWTIGPKGRRATGFQMNPAPTSSAASAKSTRWHL
jgi:Protein of unknown function (DUF4236)